MSFFPDKKKGEQLGAKHVNNWNAVLGRREGISSNLYAYNGCKAAPAPYVQRTMIVVMVKEEGDPTWDCPGANYQVMPRYYNHDDEEWQTIDEGPYCLDNSEFEPDDDPLEVEDVLQAWWDPQRNAYVGSTFYNSSLHYLNHVSSPCCGVRCADFCYEGGPQLGCSACIDGMAPRWLVGTVGVLAHGPFGSIYDPSFCGCVFGTQDDVNEVTYVDQATLLTLEHDTECVFRGYFFDCDGVEVQWILSIGSPNTLEFNFGGGKILRYERQDPWCCYCSNKMKLVSAEGYYPFEECGGLNTTDGLETICVEPYKGRRIYLPCSECDATVQEWMFDLGGATLNWEGYFYDPLANWDCVCNMWTGHTYLLEYTGISSPGGYPHCQWDNSGNEAGNEYCENACRSTGFVYQCSQARVFASLSRETRFNFPGPGQITHDDYYYLYLYFVSGDDVVQPNPPPSGNGQLPVSTLIATYRALAETWDCQGPNIMDYVSPNPIAFEPFGYICSGWPATITMTPNI